MKRVILIVLALGLLIGGFLGWKYYNWIFEANTPAQLENPSIVVPSGATVEDLIDTLQTNDALINTKSFRWVANRMSFGDANVKPGKFEIPASTSNRELINMLRLGEQTPVNVVVQPTLTLEKVCSRIADQLMVDSSQLVNYVRDSFMPESDYTEATILSMFIPNTYQFWWNASPKTIIDRLNVEHDKYWNKDRLGAARAKGMSPQEVYTLASIVERETHIDSERPVVAGVYLNRLEKDIPLQADPTVQFANGGYEIRRVLYKHLEVDSPYNTYKYGGLPPGPICMASTASIQAVLYPNDHKYLYFCAKPGAGGHAFAESLSQHNRNAREYQRWLNAEGIR